MKILLINPPSDHHSETHGGAYPPFGLLAVGTALRKNGFNVEIVDMNNNRKVDLGELLSKIDCLEAVGISCDLDNFPITQKIIAAIKKKNPDLNIIVGGPFPTVAPELYLDHTEADCVIQGEADAIEPKTIMSEMKGILRRRGIIRHLDCFAPWDYSLIDLERYINQPVNDLPSPCASIITSRGCPFECSFCASRYLGNKCRTRSIDSVRTEIEWFIESYEIQGLQFLDPTFTLDKARSLEICEMLESYDLKWSCMTRVDRLDQELVEAMAASGCVRVWLGLESFSQDVLDQSNKKTITESNVDAVKILQRNGVIAGGFIVLGLPGQTRESLQETWEEIKRLGINITPNMLYPIPGTAIFEEAQKRADFPPLLELAMGEFSRHNSSNRTAGYNLSEIPDKEITEFIQKIWKNNK